MFERKTIISTNVLRILEQSKYPLTASHIIFSLKTKSINPNKPTIYRILNKLITKKVVTEFRIRQGISYFEISGKHHHHFICDTCETAFCLNGCHADLYNIDFSKLLPNKNFQLVSHDFNLYGLCETCSKT